MPDRIKDPFVLFKRLLMLIKPFWKENIKGVTIGVIINSVALIIPMMTKFIFDEVYPSKSISLLTSFVTVMLSISLTLAIAEAIKGYFSAYLNIKISNTLSMYFYDHIQRLNIRFYEQRRVGEIMSRFGDVNSSMGAVTKALQVLFVNGIYLIIVPPIIFTINWKLAALSMFSAPITMVIITKTGHIIKERARKVSETTANINAFQTEMLTNIRTIKTLILEDYVSNKAKLQYAEAINEQLRVSSLSNTMGMINGIIKLIFTSVLTFYGWSMIITNEITLGEFMAFTSYMTYLYSPLMYIITLFQEFQQSSVNLQRMYEYLDIKKENNKIYDNNETNDISKNNIYFKGNIKISNLSFNYTKDIIILKNINMEIPSRKITVILGKSGSGKTTLLKNIVGMELAHNGVVQYDNHLSDEISLNNIRKNITVVWQEQCILTGTIWDNLTIGIDDIKKDNVDSAVKICGLQKMISEMPNGYNAQIAEFGSTLSAGQRQKIGLARALIRNTPIIILDEATSNIDLESENIILNNLRNKCSDKTIIIVTHRVTAATYADHICVMEEGIISAAGSHEQLIKSCEYYKNMYYHN